MMNFKIILWKKCDFREICRNSGTTKYRHLTQKKTNIFERINIHNDKDFFFVAGEKTVSKRRKKGQ